MTTIKHGGCHDCGNKDQEILKSTLNPLVPQMSKAVCDKCFEKANGGK